MQPSNELDHKPTQIYEQLKFDSELLIKWSLKLESRISEIQKGILGAGASEVIHTDVSKYKKRVELYRKNRFYIKARMNNEPVSEDVTAMLNICSLSLQLLERSVERLKEAQTAGASLPLALVTPPLEEGKQSSGTTATSPSKIRRKKKKKLNTTKLKTKKWTVSTFDKSSNEVGPLTDARLRRRLTPPPQSLVGLKDIYIKPPINRSLNVNPLSLSKNEEPPAALSLAPERISSIKAETASTIVEIGTSDTDASQTLLSPDSIPAKEEITSPTTSVASQPKEKNSAKDRVESDESPQTTPSSSSWTSWIPYFGRS